MTTATRKPPAHGTQSRYKGDRKGTWPGCRCRPCKSAHNKACHQRTLAHLAGKPPLIPRQPLLDHIETLHAAGMSYSLIARRAKVSDSTVLYIVRGLTQSCRREKALRILNVQPGDYDATAERPNLGSRRRVQALYAIGHNPATIAKAAGLTTSTISHLANGRYQQIDGATAAAVRAAYRKLARIPGTSQRAKTRALTQDWYGPLAWDDIDDPNAVPEIDKRCKAGRRRGETPELGRIVRLTAEGLTTEQIAARFGVHPRTITRVRSRAIAQLTAA